MDGIIQNAFEGLQAKEACFVEIGGIIKWGALPAMLHKASLSAMPAGLGKWKAKFLLLRKYEIHSRMEAILYLDGLSTRIRQDIANAETRQGLTARNNSWAGIGWEISILSFLPRVALDAGFFSEKTAWRFLRYADTYGRSVPFCSWEAYAESCKNGLAAARSYGNTARLKLEKYETILLCPGNLWAAAVPEWENVGR